MTRERKEQLSNRLVLNFGVLLIAAVALLYVNTALRNGGSARLIAYKVVMVVGIVAAALAVFLFVWGTIKKKAAIRNYSAIGLGVWVGCIMIYASKLVTWFPTYKPVKAVTAVYLAMAIYFVVFAIVTAIMLRKPVIKPESAKIVHTKKNKRR